VTDLATLKEAVRRYRKGEKSASYAGFDYLCDASDIADALLDPAPISVEALKGMGFVNRSPLGKEKWRWVSPNGQVLEAWEHNGGYRFVYKLHEAELWRPLQFEPTTVGQLLFLLLSLSEKESS
jgi:hypothetical protein